MENNQRKKIAFAFILMMGIISLFSDITHEGAASIMGAYLSLAGASAAAIGFVSGLGEFVGYSLRLVAGRITDRTHKYWQMTIGGYIADMAAITALAFVPKGGWVMACVLIIVQRTSKAVRKPAKDTMISFAAAQTGAGKGFAIQEFLDQIGAFTGPVILFILMIFKKNGDLYSAYSLCFLVLGIPAIITIALLFAAKKRYPNPEDFESSEEKAESKFHMNRAFILYNVAICLFAAGFVDFTMITMHVAKNSLIPSDTISLIYAAAMAVDAFAALFFGWLYDKRGIKVLMLSTLLSAPAAFFIFFLTAKWGLFLGVALWGIGMGAQESILKAAVTKIVPKQNRSSGFGIFQTSFGAFWFLGSWLIGIMYDSSITLMVSFSIIMQLLAIPFFWVSYKAQKELGI